MTQTDLIKTINILTIASSAQLLKKIPKIIHFSTKVNGNNISKN